LIGRWPQATTILAAVSVLVGAMAWGLKLDARTEENARRISHVEGIISQGVLPRADERLRVLERQTQYLQQLNDNLVRQIDEVRERQ